MKKLFPLAACGLIAANLSAAPVLIQRPVSVVIATTGDVPGLIATASNQLLVTCQYASSHVTDCTDRPITFVSSSPATATISPSGKITGLKTGKTLLTATVDGVKSQPLPLVVLSIPSGVYTVKLTNSSGTVDQLTVTFK